MRSESGSAAAGAALALAAFGTWGVAPIYWKAVGAVPAGELLAHRVLWSCAVALALLAATGGFGALRTAAATRAHRLPLLVSAPLIGANWLTFLWAVLHGQVLATSLGYYITPLVNVVLGVCVLGERLRPLQASAVALAALGVGQLAFAAGSLPWVALVLAVSFAFYGLLRKRAPAPPVAGFAFETLALAPFALATLAWLGATGRATLPAGSAPIDALVVASGAFTAAPLICFNAAAKRLRLVTLGIFQYVAPSLSFVLAVTLFDEPFERRELIAFAFVWGALALYSLDLARAAAESSRERRLSLPGGSPTLLQGGGDS